jgi:predicted protein tyrosine phosphatase
MSKIKFTTLSQIAAEKLDNNSDCIKNFNKPIMISITVPGEQLANIKIDIPILRLQFDDVDQNEVDICSVPIFPFTKEQAKQIFDFIEEQKPDQIITHCKAGVCRSQAVNAALSKIILQTDDKFFKEGCPNMWVYRTLLNYWFDMFASVESKKENSTHYLYPFIYKQRVKGFKLRH